MNIKSEANKISAEKKKHHQQQNCGAFFHFSHQSHYFYDVLSRLNEKKNSGGNIQESLHFTFAEAIYLVVNQFSFHSNIFFLLFIFTLRSF